MYSENINNSVEITNSSSEEIEPREPGGLKKIGKKAWELSYNAVVPGGALYGIANTLELNLPPHYTLGGSLIAGVALGVGTDKLRSTLKDRKARKEESKAPLEATEITESRTQSE